MVILALDEPSHKQKNSLDYHPRHRRGYLIGSMLVTTTGGTLMLTPAFAQGENMSGGGNYTEGNMTGSDMAGSGMATPPTVTP